MKKAILILIILAGFQFCMAQSVPGVFAVVDEPVKQPALKKALPDTPKQSLISIPMPTFTTGALVSNYKSYSGYQKSNITDTVEAYLLVSSISGYLAEPSAMLYGWGVRRLMIFQGDRMPPMTYDPYWEVESYLDFQKKKFPTNVIIWQTKLK